jgi:IS30 family transposase
VLRTGRRARRRRRRADERTTRFIDTSTLISRRPAVVAGQVAGHGEGDLVVGKGG